MPVLNISPHFTVEDIRKVRDYDYEMTKNMTKEDRRAYYRKGSERVMKEMAERRLERNKQQATS